MATKTSLVLIASLVLNAALIGVTGGRLLNQPEPKPSQQFARYGPPSDVVMAAWAQLPEPDRIELRKQMREEWALMKSDRERLHEGGRAVHEAALLEPFDETRLRNQLIVFQQREQMMQRRAEDILISHLGQMPAEARATAAVGLLTPFSARVQRDGQKRSPAKPVADAVVPDEPGN